jgi:hypothetical protein
MAAEGAGLLNSDPSNLSMPERLLQLYQRSKVLLLHRPEAAVEGFCPQCAHGPVGWAGAAWLYWRWPNNVSI